MDLVSYFQQRGGAATAADVREQVPAHELRRLLRSGTIVRVARGRYALASATTSIQHAAATTGVVSYRSAAEQHGWGQRRVPARTDVTFPRTRRVPRSWRRWITPHWSDLPEEDTDGWVTSRRRTLVDCMRMLPLIESVPIVDSALRSGDISVKVLRELALSMRGRGRTRAIWVAAMASKRAANPFESGVRAIAASVPGLQVRPQVPVMLSGDPPDPSLRLHPDLVDERLRIIIEAEGFEWHGDSSALSRDCARYNAFAADGWLVVRFSWFQVTFRPAYVYDVLVRAVAQRRR